MNRNFVVVLALSGAGAALAQESEFSVSVGVRAWYTEWTTFSYVVDPITKENLALTQVSANNELVPMPIVSVRYGNFIGSMSAFPSTKFTFADGNVATRKEFDINVGYFVMPTLALTLGYKKISQSDGFFRYEPAGPVAGLSANAPLGGAMSLYGVLGVGRLKTPSSGGEEVVKFKADYRLAELGLAYTLNTERIPQRWTFTGGYRIQVLSSKEAFGSQDGRDTTQGFTLGVIATF